MTEAALDRVMECIQNYPGQVRNSLLVMSMIRNRSASATGLKNVAEEIIFYFEVKLRTTKRKTEGRG
ncbi:MAG: hypothetical protein IPM82_21765 [Saprospiraceae bacterium]|nr:hypothetical protein [Saprospiraceae bacterium]